LWVLVSVRMVWWSVVFVVWIAGVGGCRPGDQAEDGRIAQSAVSFRGYRIPRGCLAGVW
jgi:hypothetical protein